jgi:hypothetical protein
MSESIVLGSIVAAILGIGCSFAAAGDESLASFRGGIGVIPVSSAAGAANADGTSPSVARNVVRGVNPPGQIWVIADLRAEISVDGRIRVEGKGLLLGGRQRNRRQRRAECVCNIDL